MPYSGIFRTELYMCNPGHVVKDLVSLSMNKKDMGEIINLFPFQTTSFYNKRLSIIFREKKK